MITKKLVWRNFSMNKLIPKYQFGNSVKQRFEGATKNKVVPLPMEFVDDKYEKSPYVRTTYTAPIRNSEFLANPARISQIIYRDENGNDTTYIENPEYYIKDAFSQNYLKGSTKDKNRNNYNLLRSRFNQVENLYVPEKLDKLDIILKRLGFKD